MTPLMRQYLSLKALHPDSFLFFRLGDFYELFFEDAVVVSKLLKLTLTSRDRNEENPIPMCGVPHHAARGYIAKLIEAGHKVALCEQMEDPASAKGLVRREVTQVLAPGTFVDEAALLPEIPHRLALLLEREGRFALAHADLSVGTLSISNWPDESLALEVLSRLDPRHLLISPDLQKSPLVARLSATLSTLFVEAIADAKFFSGSPPDGLFPATLAASDLEREAAAALFHYIAGTQSDLVSTLSPFERFSEQGVLPLDRETEVHLEIFKTYDGRSAGTFFHHLNQTKTPMGARLLRHFVSYPSTDLSEIGERQSAVTVLLREGLTRHSLRQGLDSVYDLERLISKISAGRATPRDLLALLSSLKGVFRLGDYLREGLVNPRLAGLREGLSVSPSIIEALERGLCDEPPLLVRDGGVIREGVSEDLDRLRRIARDGKGVLTELERTERDKTGISSLKVRYNRVFGYYIEVTHTHSDRVPPHYVRKQTTANSERYITEDLKRLEEEILSAEQKIIALETALFNQLCERIAAESASIRRAARAVAELDVFLAFADLAEKHHYTCPTLHSGFDLTITEGRHPTLEIVLPKGQFISNDIAFTAAESEMILITGPNMAGKSTVMRQTALIVLLAQMGAFVPAKAASIGIVDRIFTRIGASDNLLKGQSTFMTEMVEAAGILKEATRRSLILLDEIGRGTSTFDGLSLARAIAEHLIEKVGAKTLFATHYHELAELEEHFPQVKGFTMSIREWQGSLLFLYHFVKGHANRSYGIEVGKLAGLPDSVISRAKVILRALELGETVSEQKLELGTAISDIPVQLDLFSRRGEACLETLRNLDVNALTPLEALTLLSKLKEAV